MQEAFDGTVYDFFNAKEAKVQRRRGLDSSNQSVYVIFCILFAPLLPLRYIQRAKINCS